MAAPVLHPFAIGADSAKDMLLAIQRCNRESVDATGDLDVAGVASIMDRYAGGSRVPRGFLLAMAEFIATAVEANVIDLEAWLPLQATPALETPLSAVG